MTILPAIPATIVSAQTEGLSGSKLTKVARRRTARALLGAGWLFKHTYAKPEGIRTTTGTPVG